MDGDLSAKIVVANKVNTAVIGSYVVTYSVTDTSGNSAQAERNVRVQAREGTGGGGGGAAGFELVLLLALAIMAGNWQRAAAVARRNGGTRLASRDAQRHDVCRCRTSRSRLHLAPIVRSARTRAAQRRTCPRTSRRYPGRSPQPRRRCPSR
jgi:hypothetical protein